MAGGKRKPDAGPAEPRKKRKDASPVLNAARQIDETVEHAAGPSTAARTSPDTDGVQTQYRRVQRQRNGRWEVLVPRPTALPTPKPIQIYLGAQFGTAEEAARAADRALLAMQGAEAARPQLNFPAATYGADAQRRFGPALSEFLAGICREAAQARASSKKKAAPLRGAQVTSWMDGQFRKEAKVLERMRRDPLYVDQAMPCGVCPGCRQPWGTATACHRVLLARQLEYSAGEAARLAAYGAEGAAARDLLAALRKTDKAAATRLKELIRQQDEARAASEPSSEPSSSQESGERGVQGDAVAREQVTGGGGAAAAAATSGGGAAAAARRPPPGLPSPPGEELQWVLRPRAGWDKRIKLNDAYDQARSQAEAAAAASAAAAAAARAPPPAHAAPELHGHGEELLLPGGLSAAAPPADRFDPGMHAAVLRHAEAAAAAGARLSLVGEADPRFVAPPSATGGHQCALCRGWHGPGSLLQCPVLRATNAVPLPPPECAHCAHLEAPGCARCASAGLAPALWRPPQMRTPWVEGVRPATLDVMHAAQGVASAAIVDLARPQLAGKLGPKALLAIGLLVEEVAAAEVRARAATARPPEEDAGGAAV